MELSCQLHCPAALLLGKKPLMAQSQPGNDDEEKNFCPCQESET
jgi:hypothetical protein